MKWITILYSLTLTFIFTAKASNTYGQVNFKKEVLLKGETLKLKVALQKISELYQVDFAFNSRELPLETPITLSTGHKDLRGLMDYLSQEVGLSYAVVGKSLVLTKDDQNLPESPLNTQQQIMLNAKMLDQDGADLSGVTIENKRTKVKTTSKSDGSFQILVQDGDILIYSMVGYETIEESLKFPYKLQIVMKSTMYAIEGVVVKSGIVDRRAESFTGSAVTITKEELFRAGNQNVLQSLKNIDPSFRLTENLDMGSDPNTLPNITVRGESSMPDLTGTYSANPNEPLFILDGFQTTLARIYDLDMNRIQSVTILKDAAAKAIYGSKAGNGVVIIETVQPAKGRMRLNYNAQVDVEAPDLTGYNLMNATEKLQWEKDHNVWFSPFAGLNDEREVQYNALYQDVHSRGIDTYWLSQPLRTGVGQRHNLSVEGGDEYLRYNANFSYRDVTGAMKGSDRKTYTANTTLSYRYKNILFRNQLEVNRNIANNSTYGSFSEYVNLNPYWSPYAENGQLAKQLGDYDDRFSVANPLYNASLKQIDRTDYTQLVNNFFVEWTVLKDLRVRGNVGYNYQRTGGDKFLPPSHTTFLTNTEANGLIDYKGRWTKTTGAARMLEGNMSVDYNFRFDKHMFFTNATLNMSENTANTNTFVGEGFGSDNVNDISMATYYQRGGSPLGTENTSRSLAVLGVFNYSYDDRFLTDISLRRGASSIYGKNGRWSTESSFGLGYNLHNEPFIRDLNIFQQFRVRGSMGYTGTQNADSYSTLATYQYIQEVYDGIKGLDLLSIPNPNLKWQRVLDYNGGVDFSVFNNKLNVRFDMYKRITNNQLADLSAAPSMGFSSFKTNIGKVENKGKELTLRYQLFNRANDRSYFNINASAAQNVNRLVDIGDAFKAFNDESDASYGSAEDNALYTKPVARYYEGQAINAIWVMNSLGIDPATGQEVFLDLQGNMTNLWAANQLIIAGTTDPKVNGNFGFTAGYKGFSLSLTCTYRFGGRIYNSTLVERVENVNGYGNLDKRILDAWYEVGDVSIYKRPQVGSSNRSITRTQPTSRFVQRNDEIYFSTINLGYDVMNRALLKKLGMDRLRMTFYTNELLRLSSIQVERGTSYPFARNFSFSLQAGF